VAKGRCGNGAGAAWIPIVVCPGLAAGATLRDGVVAANAGFLASLVLYQCVRPGAPLIYGIEDLTGFSNLSGLVLALGLARRYDVPISVDGLSTTAVTWDRAAAERGRWRQRWLSWPALTRCRVPACWPAADL